MQNLVTIDCDTCSYKGSGCGECVMSALLDPRPAMTESERRAMDVLTSHGLIGPLHLAVVSAPGDGGVVRQPTGYERTGRYSA